MPIILRSFKYFPEFADIIYRNLMVKCSRGLLLWIKKCTWISFVVLGMRSEGNDPKNGENNSWCLLHNNAPTHQSVLVKGYLSKGQSDGTGISPLLLTWFQIIFYNYHRLKSALKGRPFCDATDIIENETEQLKRLSQNGFQECFQHFHSRW